ncbi:ArsR/SmtB family transcription factor, partial [Neisseria sp. P0001.S006]
MEIKRLSTIIKLIANPERMAILFLLLDADRSITELAQALDSS